MNKLVVFLVLAILLSGCAGMGKPDSSTLDSSSQYYRIIEIEGMTCILWEGGYRGLTCNWDEYTGE